MHNKLLLTQWMNRVHNFSTANKKCLPPKKRNLNIATLKGKVINSAVIYFYLYKQEIMKYYYERKTQCFPIYYFKIQSFTNYWNNLLYENSQRSCPNSYFTILVNIVKNYNFYNAITIWWLIPILSIGVIAFLCLKYHEAVCLS